MFGFLNFDVLVSNGGGKYGENLVRPQRFGLFSPLTYME